MILSDTPTVPPAILEICQFVVASCGFVLVEARTLGKPKNLQVTIFHPQKDLSIDDCEQISRKLYAQLETQPSYLGTDFTIEVQSPGIDRRLKTARDFEVFIGQTIELTLSSKMFDLGDCFICRLAAFDGKSITVDELIPHPMTSRLAKRSRLNGTVVLPPAVTLNLDQVNTVKLTESTTSDQAVPAA